MLVAAVLVTASVSEVALLTVVGVEAAFGDGEHATDKATTNQLNAATCQRVTP